MFESDDFDQVLSQFDFPEISSSQNKSKPENILNDLLPNPLAIESKSTTESKLLHKHNFKKNEAINDRKNEAINDRDIVRQMESFKSPTSLSVNNSIETRVNTEASKSQTIASLLPNNSKRKLISSFFDTNSKRKFPGPAGLLTGSFEQNNDENVCQMELLSQDIEFSQNNLHQDIFESPLWKRLLEDIPRWKLGVLDNISTIKQQALAGNLRRRKAQLVAAFVEAVDRSAADPLVILRDSSGNIKCTLHREAWNTFSRFIASELCALILVKPTVLTTGATCKKHYLNITLGNVYAVYSSAVFDDTSSTIAEGYKLVYEEDFTVIKAERLHSTSLSISGAGDDSLPPQNDLLEGLYGSLFADEIF